MTAQRPSYLQRLTAWRPGAYLRSSASLFGWMIVRAAAQAGMVLLMARLLGPEGYGHFIAVLAIASFFSPLAGLGLSGVLLRDLARNPERLPELLSASLKLWWLSTLGFGMAATAVTLWAFASDISITLIACFTLAEISSSSLTELAARLEQSQHRANRFGAINTGLVLVRLIGLGLYVLIIRPEVDGWMGVYAAASLIYTVALYLWLIRQHRPIGSLPMSWSLIIKGLPFTVGAVSYRMQAEFNKPLLAQLGYVQAGYFSAAQRMIDLASLPMMALQENLWSRVYVSNNPKKRLLHTGLVLIVIGLIVGSMVSFTAPLLPVFLGASFEATIKILSWLIWIPIVQSIRNLMNVYLAATHRTHILTFVSIFSTLSSLAMTTFLVFRYGLEGAVSAAYLTELVAIVCLILFPRFITQKIL